MDEVTIKLADLILPSRNLGASDSYLQTEEVLQGPDVLMIQLSRFGFQVTNAHTNPPLGFSYKINNLVNIPLEGLRFGGRKYNLHAIINHIGSTLESGHYTATVRGESGQWVEFNDSVVTEKKPEAVVTRNAYIAILVPFK